jgi:hypothetical protein
VANALSQNRVNATLEQRIKAALSSDATLDDLASLIIETAASFAPVPFDRLSADWGTRGRLRHAGATGAGGRREGGQGSRGTALTAAVDTKHLLEEQVVRHL